MPPTLSHVELLRAPFVRSEIGPFRFEVPLAFGPRVMNLRIGDRASPFMVYEDQIRRQTPDVFLNFGGHRLWAAPEISGWTDASDLGPTEVEVRGDAVWTAGENPVSRLWREISVEPLGEGLLVRHRLTNRGDRTVRIAPWALTVLKGGGEAVLAQEPYASHEDVLLPARPMVLWPYTDMSDPRVSWGRRLIRLRHDPEGRPFKLGLWMSEGVALWHGQGLIFGKRFQSPPASDCPDFGVNFETFTNQDMLELESLGAVRDVEPGGSVDHAETWLLCEGAGCPDGEADAVAWHGERSRQIPQLPT
ncbi:MAG: hypothetical protein MH204_09535 [Fimbriimonadaceae bacterium]|nr:hypothetical protein [Fimbriimonadaceae bacterium]